MFSGAAACGACDAEDGARGNGGALGGEDLGEVAVADAEVAVADGDEVAGARVVTYFVYRAGEHGEDEVAVGGEVDATVHRALAGERVGAVAEGRRDFEIAERIGHGDVACPLRLFCGVGMFR